ncbi:conserved hypothetical protein [Talaromyces stipitatus ATCC 10500]|uniref:F-box domain protein n=1 Tax=Talaromyces stipitatus (strain ATCC 10500 / CBS 375.48 / QM 6759 / NRRL 1006) TaxID=441959 RepID=B8MNK2_TALSN|nr:uncharacterized protein TSTA_103170 [Talaromyces stipitatus ATCC 10500]EED14091.1 conserved hypothetical protein [Talaromyces stipitatus ATCC 10500]
MHDGPIDDWRVLDPVNFGYEKLTKTFYEENGSQNKASISPYTRELDLIGPKDGFYGCFRRRLNTSSGLQKSDLLACHAQMMGDVSRATNDILQELQIDRLRHFGWHMGYCVPASVLGQSGYIPHFQPNLRSLSLKVDSACVGGSLAGLASLKNLRHFSWRGIDSVRAFSLIRLVLKNNAEHLVSLELEVLRVEQTQENIQLHEHDLIWLGLLVPNHNHFPNSDMGVWLDKDVRLKSLTYLSLRHVRLLTWQPQDTLTFDLSKLENLHLYKCPGTLDFFQTWTISDCGMSLRSLRAVINEPMAGRIHFTLEHLLIVHGCQLEELYLTFIDMTDPIMSSNAWDKTSVKRMACSFYETRLSRANDVPPPFCIIRGMTGGALPSLEGMAFWCPPHILRRMLLEIRVALPSLKVMHFRVTNKAKNTNKSLWEEPITGGKSEDIANMIRFLDRYLVLGDEACRLSEVIDFASWAFENPTFPNLEIIAFGNFSNPDTCLVLCRKKGFPRFKERTEIFNNIAEYWKKSVQTRDFSFSLPFDFVHPEDLRPWTGLEKCRDMLTANNADKPWYEKPGQS